METRYHIATKSGTPLTFAGLRARTANLDIENCMIIVTERDKAMSTMPTTCW